MAEDTKVAAEAVDQNREDRVVGKVGGGGEEIIRGMCNGRGDGLQKFVDGFVALVESTNDQRSHAIGLVGLVGRRERALLDVGSVAFVKSFRFAGVVKATLLGTEGNLRKISFIVKGEIAPSGAHVGCLDVENVGDPVISVAIIPSRIMNIGYFHADDVGDDLFTMGCRGSSLAYTHKYCFARLPSFKITRTSVLPNLF